MDAPPRGEPSPRGREGNFVLENLSTYMKQLLYVQNIILDAVNDDGDYAGDNADDNYDADDNYNGVANYD